MNIVMYFQHYNAPPALPLSLTFHHYYYKFK